MKLEDIEKMTDDTISCEVAASVIGCNPQLLRLQAREDREALGFPVIVVRKRVHIPRLAFLAVMRGDKTGDGVTA